MTCGSWRGTPCADYVWGTVQHRNAPVALRRVIHTLMVLRSVAESSVLSTTPNEILFLIFELCALPASTSSASASASSGGYGAVEREALS